MGRIIKELERIYNVKNGRPSLEISSNGTSLTQEDIAEQLGMMVLSTLTTP